MCLIFIAYRQRRDWPVIVLSNRDEFFQRPSLEGHFWAPQFTLLGGRDQEHGGSWLMTSRSGRLAAVTNFRDPTQPAGRKSRGALVANYVASDDTALDYLSSLTPSDYTGFNLICGTPVGLFYASNRDPKQQPLALKPGCYGLSNHLLDTRWPKVTSGKRAFIELIQKQKVAVDDLFELMADTRQADDESLPNTGIGKDKERLLSSRFIPGNLPHDQFTGYGTRTTTVVMLNADGGGQWFERNHTPHSINRRETLAFSWGTPETTNP